VGQGTSCLLCSATHAGQILESPSCSDAACSHLLSSTYRLHRELLRSVIYSYQGYAERPRSLGQKLRRIRLDLRLQIKDVAAAIGVCETTIINWERRGVTPSPELFQRLREFYRSRRHSLAGQL
jgi:DNA-binding XRE family transcriptional regulator